MHLTGLKLARLCLAFFILGILNSCEWFKRRESDQIPIAKVGESYLYEEDLIGLYPSDIRPDDSINIRTSYVNNWVKDELIFQQALQNLPDSLKNKDKELENYYRSLIRHQYEQELVNQELDTAVSYQEISNYYNKYEGSFVVKRPIARARYVLLGADVPKQDKVEEWLKNESQENTDSLDKYFLTYAKKYQLDHNKWNYLSDMMVDLQLKDSVFKAMLNANGLQKFNDSVNIVYMKVYELREQGAQSPIQLESAKIRSLIKNRKKVHFINNLEQEIFQNSKTKKRYEIFR